jgi:hypothetical protein
MNPRNFAIAAIGICVLTTALSVSCAGCQYFYADEQQKRAEGYGRNYARTILRISNPQVACQSIDNDADGFLTCAVSNPQAADGALPTEILCPANAMVEWNKACKLKMFRQGNYELNQQQ